MLNFDRTELHGCVRTEYEGLSPLSGFAEKAKMKGWKWIVLTPRYYSWLKKQLTHNENLWFEINQIEGMPVVVLKEDEYDRNTEFAAAAYFNVSNALMWDTKRESNSDQYNVEDVYKMEYFFYNVINKEEDGEEDHESGE